MHRENAIYQLEMLLDQIRQNIYRVEGFESLCNEEAGHCTIHWILTSQARQQRAEPDPLLARLDSWQPGAR